MRRIVLLAALMLAWPATQVLAGPMIGQQVTLGYGSPHSGSGGEFLVSGAGFTAFDTFCVEYDEHFSPGSTYWVGDISTEARYNGHPNVPVLLNQQVAWLYSGFRAGTINYLNTVADAGLLQDAIWMWLGEIAVDTNQKYYKLANDNASGFGFGNVRILNLYTTRAGDATSGYTYSGYAQDQLTLVDPVPEPGALMLFGTGLVGLAAAIRRRGK